MRIGARLLLVAGAFGLATLLQSAPAGAHTCSSACNQVRRACNSVAKAGSKVEFALCADGRDACRTACEIDNSVCVQVCLDANDACVLGCGDQTCLDGCVAAFAACPDECPDCCNAARTTCRDIAKDARTAARLLCTDSRTTCNETCVSVDGNCVRSCVRTRRGLEADAKRSANACKNGCTGGPDRRACMRSCRKILNQQFQLFSNQEAVCIGTTCIRQ